MSHAYPLGQTLQDALKPEAKAARTIAEAEALANGFRVAELAIDWVNVTESEAEAMLAAGTGDAHGHLQRYEDETGHPVIAVSWWRLETAKAAPKRKAKAKKPEPEPAEAEAPDHTDDLYFRRGRTKPSRRRYVDPRQLDLFRQSKDKS
ncbi:MAG TPA: hypothetical protein PLR76_15580 [Hyphomonas sp.]|nr:hypothetical protein [Hyphomonas sp.]MCA8906081.1 hypothetical protein [Hyphomonas sp.]MCB9962170.1 hypothetical protein [Hyphomonas sp.]HPE49824.1 hypothetical protein [Hyphomonas sp.]